MSGMTDKRIKTPLRPGGITGFNGVAHDNLILNPGRRYREWILQASSLNVGRADFSTPRSGGTFTMPDIIVHPVIGIDSDNDGLHDVGEFIMGTDPPVTVQIRDFPGTNLPIGVVLTPESGNPGIYDADVNLTSGNPAQTTVNVGIPVNIITRIHAWTR